MQALTAALQVQDKAAFNVPGNPRRVKLNKNAARYHFPDESVLKILGASQRWEVYGPDGARRMHGKLTNYVINGD